MNTLTCPMPAARVTAGAATRRTMPAIAVVGAAWIGRMVLMAKLRRAS